MNQELNHFKQNESEEGINFREIIERYLHFWYWFVLGALLSLSIAWVYLHYSIPIYQSKASVLFKDDKEGSSSAEMELFNGLGLSSSGNNLENEIEILKSRTLLERVAKKLKLNYTFHLIGDKSGILRSEIYTEAPITFEVVGHDSLFYNKSGKFKVSFTNQSSYFLSTYEGDEIGSFGYGNIISTPIGKFIINKTSELSKSYIGKSILLSIQSIESVVSNLQQSILVESTSKESKVLTISLKGINIDKNNDIINELISQHKIDAIEDKNEVASNTSAFINERMKFIAAELSTVEDEGQQYKTKYNLVDVTSDAMTYLEKESQTDKDITKTTIQLSLANFMNDYITNHQGYSDLLPSNLGFEDQSIANLISQYNTLALDRNRLLLNSSDKNPSVQKIEGQLGSLKSSIITS